MQVGSVMRVQLVTAAPEESTAEAIRRMVDANTGAIVVVEDGVPVGIFTERDVLRLAGNGANFESVLLRTTMTRDPLTISGDDGILEAAQLMGERKLRHLPVVQDGHVVGIVSMRDLLGFITERLYADQDEATAETARALFRT
jgi:CBS domain-containing protein